MKHLKKFIALVLLLLSISAFSKDEIVYAPSYAWKVIQPLGLQTPATIDTLFIDYSLKAVPSAVSPAWATTGNFGAPGIDLVFFQRKPLTDFFFADGLYPWIPSLASIKFYNTRRPMTILSYNFAGDSYNFQDRLQGVFSGNVNKQLQFGAIVDYLFSKGSYEYQATKNFTWGFNASYIADKFEVQFYQYHYNLTNRENGGIEDDLYITDPAEIQGGNTTVDPKSIPTNLTQAQNRTRGGNVFLNAKYKLGFWRDIEQDDSTTIEEFVPVTAFVWTLDWNEGKHHFINASAQQDAEFWSHRYLSTTGTSDFTTYSSLRNTLGVSLLEGFNKWAKFGLAAYAAIDFKKYKQTADSMLYLPIDERPAGLTDYDGPLPPSTFSDTQLSIGAQITKLQGSFLKYEATGELGMTGRTAGDFHVDGNVTVNIPFLKDTLSIRGFGGFYNETAPYFVENYISNHFIWDNKFNKIKRFTVGGELSFPKTWTRIRGELQNINNYVYFDGDCLPAQYNSNIQIISLALYQNFQWRAIHLDNTVILQKSSKQDIIPLPKFVIYSNLYFQFKIAKVLDIQLGCDFDYYARHTAMGYQPATMTFFTQTNAKVGGFPFMNAYANMKLGKTRFYLMYSHFNDGLIGKPNYFSIPHYPLNPARFQMGLSVEFTD